MKQSPAPIAARRYLILILSCVMDLIETFRLPQHSYGKHTTSSDSPSFTSNLMILTLTRKNSKVNETARGIYAKLSKKMGRPMMWTWLLPRLSLQTALRITIMMRLDLPRLLAQEEQGPSWLRHPRRIQRLCLVPSSRHPNKRNQRER